MTAVTAITSPTPPSSLLYSAPHCVLCLNYLCLPGFAYITHHTHTIYTTLPLSARLIKEYCEEFRDIISKPKKTAAGPTENGITLVNQYKFTEELPVMSLPFFMATFILFFFATFYLHLLLDSYFIAYLP